ncbi:ISL3 family transposase [Dysgonomonas termitidis]
MNKKVNKDRCNIRICKLYETAQVKIKRSIIKENLLYLYAHSTKGHGTCPSCGRHSKAVRSRYIRKLMDLPASGYSIRILLQVRRFSCKNTRCKKKIFSEQYPGYALPYARRTLATTVYLQKILLEISARKGAYITDAIHLPVSASTCLRIVGPLNIPIQEGVDVVGIDDWASRKGMSYGTILVNAKTGHPIDLLASRDYADVVKWLSGYPQVKYVTRDRASSYAKAITDALPGSSQIADKFHLVKNLSDTIYDEVLLRYQEIKKTFTEEHKKGTPDIHPENINVPSDMPDTGTDIDFIRPPSLHRRQELFEQIHRLSKSGFSQRQIAKTLHINRNMVRYYLARQELHPRFRTFTNNYEDYLDEIKGGCRKGLTVKDIFRSISRKGFRGKVAPFYQWFRYCFPDYKSGKYKVKQQAISPQIEMKIRFGAISARKLAIYVSNPEWGVCEATGKRNRESQFAQEIITSSSLLQELRYISQSFRKIINGDNEDALDTWITEIKQFNIKNINSFVNGIIRDRDAICNAIRYPWTNGLVEGNVNRLKNKKREMYGRAGFELLRRKVAI